MNLPFTFIYIINIRISIIKCTLSSYVSLYETVSLYEIVIKWGGLGLVLDMAKHENQFGSDFPSCVLV